MPKRSRSSSSSSSSTEREAKKQKTGGAVSAPVTYSSDAAVSKAPTAVAPGPVDVITPDDVDVEEATEDPEVGAPVAAPTKATKGKAATKKDPKPKAEGKKTGSKKAPTCQEVFDGWKPTAAQVAKPTNNTWWGIKPTTGAARPVGIQPIARTSNGATNPPMWENRGFRFKRGSRYVKYFGPVKPEGADDGPDLDQEDLLILKMVDMRTNKKTGLPRRTADTYVNPHGKPNDWNDMQAIKLLNDRRTQALDRVTRDAPWTKLEREYLAQLLTDNPDASIWELTELHNDRFMGQECTTGVGFELSEGRTVESVRHEYVTYKPLYDAGEAPETRWSRNKSDQGKRQDQFMTKKFGEPNRTVSEDFESQSDSDDEDSKIPKKKKKTTPKKEAKPKKEPKKKATPKTKKSAKKSTKTAESDSEDEGKLTIQAADPIAKQFKLSDADEELLELGGVYNPEEIRTSVPRHLSFSDGDLSDPPSDLDNDTLPVAQTDAPSGTSSNVLGIIPDSPLSDPPSDLEDYNAAVGSAETRAIATVLAAEKKAIEAKKAAEASKAAKEKLKSDIATKISSHLKANPKPKLKRSLQEDDDDADVPVSKKPKTKCRTLPPAFCDSEEDEDELGSPEPKVVVAKETLVEKTTIVEEQAEEEVVVAETPVVDVEEELEEVDEAIHEQVTPVASPEPEVVIHTPRAIREVEIDDNYDDEEEDGQVEG
jgi:hypothetical protein